ncbi:MAG TPA: DEAD/DEAH box helicase [Candidatus Dormibacteraeota bacterium]|nr:DEAD/DEAH box helicase [Candidatus Dormibacteraeota bacterium]
MASLSLRQAASGTIATLGDAIDSLIKRQPARAAEDAALRVITAIHEMPEREAEWAPMPSWLRPELAAAYRGKGIERLYSHQAAAAEAVRAGRNVVVVTPTASGKTLCYNLPVLNAILENADARALYLFPTKALAQDQLAELHDLEERLGDAFAVFTYDGDTPSDARKAIRERGHIVLSNPDMLHAGILPHHTRWMRLFENLRFVVIDELHTYRGVFGSHVTNVLRRLARIARFYGSKPQFICSSATIANPRELAERLAEQPFDLVDENGAPAARKTFVFYNPPLVNRRLGIRRSYINESRRVAQEFLGRDLQTLVFANSRLHTELLVTYLLQTNPSLPGRQEAIRGYRGGYLPGERREIERGLREGRIRAVVATSALELGVDIGSLDAVVMAGYPGRIASTWQRAGRAGRRNGHACAVLVASSAPLDQFIVTHPEYFFGQSPERAFVEPDNPEILLNHLKCAAFELPLRAGERFGGLEIDEPARALEGAGFLHRSGAAWHWTDEAYPADAISLRAVTSDNFVIMDLGRGAPEAIGEVDFSSALTTVHPKAIYLHDGAFYSVERLDFDDRKAYVRQVETDYFTDAIRYTEVRILEEAARAPAGEGRAAHGDVLVRSQVVGFKKIKFFTNENVGAGPLELPENEMHTTSFWITLERGLVAALPFPVSERQAGMYGLLCALEAVATLLLMCDRRDLGTAIGERPPDPGSNAAAPRPEMSPSPEVSRTKAQEFFEPNLYLYDAYPGGIGFSRPLFEMRGELLARTRELIRSCACEHGCPSCVGPAEGGWRTKEVALAILERLCE